MLPKHIVRFIIILAICTLGFSAAPPGAKRAYAGQEDAALFQEALSTYGQWLNYGQHGLVWRPRQVDKNWRPYTNGRWVPTKEGYVFETDEPWGWATYHYGNWLPTNDHGWVWVPGRTWYPHTVNWRTNDENVGWAPVPPPDSMVSDTFYSDGYPSSDYGSAGLNSYGYSSNNILPSNWIFTRASDFLLGWGQPYSPMYSYAYAGSLLGPQYLPIVYERTVYVTNYVSPSYAANAYYNWGPPLTYITKVTTIQNIENDHRYKDLRLAHLRNVMPPANLGQRHPAWREVLPMAGTARQGHLRSVPNFKMASGKLNYPDAIPAPASLNPNNNVTRPSSPLAAKQQLTASGKTLHIDNSSLTSLQSGPSQLNQSANQSQVPDLSRTGTAATASELKKRQELSKKTLPAPTTTSPRQSVGQQPPVSPPPQPYQSRRDSQRVEPRAYQENQLRRYHEQHIPPDQQRAEQELRMRQQQRLLRSGGSRKMQLVIFKNNSSSAANNNCRLDQRRQAEMQRYQQMQQQRQAEIMRQQQIQQQQQAEMVRQQQMQQQQHHQAEMMRARQMQQQQQIVRQAPPPAQHAPTAQYQKKRDNQQQQ